MTAPLPPRFPGDAQPCPGMTPGRSPPLIALTLRGSKPQIVGVTPSRGPRARLRHGGIGGRAGARRRQPVLRMAMVRSPLFLLLLLRGAGEAPGTAGGLPPVGSGRCSRGMDVSSSRSHSELRESGSGSAPAVLERGGPAVTFAPGGPVPPPRHPLRPPSMPSPKMLREKRIAGLTLQTPVRRWSRFADPVPGAAAGAAPTVPARRDPLGWICRDVLGGAPHPSPEHKLLGSFFISWSLWDYLGMSSSAGASAVAGG